MLELGLAFKLLFSLYINFFCKCVRNVEGSESVKGLRSCGCSLARCRSDRIIPTLGHHRWETFKVFCAFMEEHLIITHVTIFILRRGERHCSIETRHEHKASTYRSNLEPFLQNNSKHPRLQAHSFSIFKVE